MMVYICCSGGATSGMFCSKIEKAVESECSIYVNYIDDLQMQFKQDKDAFQKYDLVLGCGPVEAITPAFMRESNFKDMFSLVIIAPQMRFKIEQIRKVLAPYGIPCETLDVRAFGTMDGKKGLEIIKEALNKLEK